MPPLLSISNLSISFSTEDGLVLDHVSLDVGRGEIVALVGESGSGKSITSLSILRLLPSPPARYLSGEILFTGRDGQTIDLLRQEGEALRHIRGAAIAMIFQEPMTSLNPVFTCGDQVAEAILAHRKVSAGEAREQAIALFGRVRLPDPEGMYNRWPHQLSGGQKQRVMIAMAMSSRPSLLICDEPTTALDVTVQKTILELIRQLQETEDMGVIFITHDLGVVAEIADRAVVLYKGKVVEQGPVRELFHHPRHPYTQGLLNCRPALHVKGERLPVVSDYLNGSIPPSAPAAPNLVSTEALVKVENLQVWYPAKKSFLGKGRSYTKAVDGVSFDVYKGETLGLVGESGCGKTTLGRALLRLVEPTGGRVFFDGADLGGLDAAAMKQLRSRMQLIFQDPYSSLNPRLTIGAAIAEAMQVHGLGTTEKERRRLVVQLLEKVSLTAEYAGRWPHELSGGQRQRVVIARALALRPDFIVADESVSALDVSVQAQVLNLLNDLKNEFGFTVVFISHDLSVIRYISDRILVMNKGRIEEAGDAETLYNHPRSEYTKKLIAAIPRLR
ncbi:ABC transporter ATP-binding protein [Puia dinghuensis]|uniref:ABC transporter ATP-binding protein n=1 Tax=Puia dinghuensis TaxID=1792502 RepID=A0A8J2XU26_9BACT|nr:ABC transporter ATP-binding protein [Puia dinghuensis]GGB04384.1 ABC transporter ATP-binding protein [Puia dinghuensis]